MMEDSSQLRPSDLDLEVTLRGLHKGDLTFGRFRLVKVLGRGGMGVVWLAEDLRLGREVALKFTPDLIRQDDVSVEELKKETLKGLELAHPHIIKVYDFLVDQRYAAISMEYVNGESLSELRLKQSRQVFETDQIELWVEQCLQALHYAHTQAKIIHRDLKPANILVNHRGDAKIADFGIARSLQDALYRATMTSASCAGTLAYMSPQQADGFQPEVTDDIYSFGVTLFELLTGLPPFYRGNIAKQLALDEPPLVNVRRREFGLTGVRNIPVAWEEAIRACLSKSSKDRPQSAMELLSMLRAAGSKVSMAAGSSHALKKGDFDDLMSAQTLRQVAQPSEVSSTSRPWISIGILTLCVLGAGYWFWPTKKTEPMDSGRSNPAESLASEKVEEPRQKVAEQEIAKAGTEKTPSAEDSTGAMSTQANPDLPAPDQVSENKKMGELQSLVNAAKPGEWVVIPDGVYEEQLRFKEGVKLRAATLHGVIVKSQGVNGAALLVEASKGGAIEGFVFQHMDGDLTDDEAWPVVMVNQSEIQFTQCRFETGITHGLSITGGSSVQLDQIDASRNRLNGVLVESGSHVTVKQGKFSNNGASGVELRHIGTRATLQDVQSYENTGSGAVVKDGASLKLEGESSLIKNREAGVVASGPSSSLRVDGAKILENLIGVTVTGKARAEIQFCEIINSKQLGMELRNVEEATFVKRSKISGCKLAGIYAMSVNGGRLLLQNNIIEKNAGSGIVIEGENFQPTVEENRCRDNAEYGLYATGKVSGLLKNNSWFNNQLGGMMLEDVSPDLKSIDNILQEESAFSEN